MRPRELAHLLGFGRRYFHAFWARELDIFEAPVKLQDATGALFVHIPKTAGVSVCRSVFETEQLFGHAPASGWKKRDRSMRDITARLGKPYTPAHTNSSKRAQTMLERLYHEDFLLYRERFKAAA